MDWNKEWCLTPPVLPQQVFWLEIGRTRVAESVEETDADDWRYIKMLNVEEDSKVCCPDFGPPCPAEIHTIPSAKVRQNRG